MLTLATIADAITIAQCEQPEVLESGFRLDEIENHIERQQHGDPEHGRSGGPGAGQDAFRAVVAEDAGDKPLQAVFHPGHEIAVRLAAVFREFPAENTEEPAVEPVEIQAHRQGAFHQRQADEEGEAGEQQELQHVDHV